MKVLEKGHVYQPTVREIAFSAERELSVLARGQKLVFVNKEPGAEHDGTTTQEVIRILLDRTRHCNNCLPHPNNERVIYHLRMALVLHEARALERKTEKGEFMPEYLMTGDDGHILVSQYDPSNQPLHTTILEPYSPDWERECKHPKKVSHD